MFIDKHFNKIDIEDLKPLIGSGSAYIWGDSLHNNNIFDLFSPSSFKGIFDNAQSKWGEERNSLKIQGFSCQENLIIISAIEDIFSLIPQLQKLDIKNYYFYRSEELHSRYEKPELSFYKKSSRKFLGGSNFKYLHVIPDQKFILPVLDVVKKGFSIQEHAFLIYHFNRSNPNDLYKIWQIYLELENKYNNIFLLEGFFNCDEYANDRLCNIGDVIEKCSRIVFHGEWFSKSSGELFSKYISAVKRKGIFIPWSGTLGEDECNMPYIHNILRHCPIVVLGTCNDNRFAKIQKNCRFTNLHRFMGAISYTTAVDLPNKQINARPKVFIAHSCYSYNKAIESMQYLTKFTGRIDVYCIGSYGSEDYIKAVQNYGENLFGKDFHFVTEFMNYDAYVSFLNSMDVAVMAMEDGAGMTTIRILGYVGAKLYFLPGCNTSEYATNLIGYKWYDIDTIERESLQEFCSNEYSKYNYEIAKADFDIKEKIKSWNKLLTMAW